MSSNVCSTRRVVSGSVAMAALLGSAGVSVAGGIAVREQSAFFQGLSFAGAAAGDRLSSGYWNSAAFADAGIGLQTESSYSLIIGDAEVTARDGTLEFPGVASQQIGNSEQIARLALVGASYASYRLSEDLVFGVAMNAPFGLGVEAEDENWGGEYHGRRGKIFTLNLNPTIAYDLTSTLSIGVGVQIQYGQIIFKGNPGLLPDHPNAGFEVDDIAFGGTAGILWKPTSGTSIGLGYRSPIRHELEGDFGVAGNQLTNIPTPIGFLDFPFEEVGLEGSVTLPEIVTLSLRQAIDPLTRLMATVEWTHWERLDRVDFKATSDGGAVVAPIATGDIVSSFEFNWHDGWFFALGGEHDWQPNLTLRAGVAYEISPIQNDTERFALITDSDRVWLSGGATYKYSEWTSFDFAYTHIFFEDAGIDRPQTTGGNPLPLIADVEQSADIIAVGMKTKW